MPAAFRDCPAWRVELFNPYGEGGTYPPYGNAGTFDGIGLGTTGASSSGPVRRYSLGIDYSGLWALRLSLAGETLDGCSQTLSQRAYGARFTLNLDGGRLGAPDRPTSRPTATSSPASSADPSPAPSPSPLAAPEPAASEKYQNPVDPEATPGWVYPAVAVSGVALLGVVLVAVRTVLRRRRQGW